MKSDCQTSDKLKWEDLKLDPKEKFEFRPTTIEITSYDKFENGKRVSYGGSIERDFITGEIINIREPTPISSMGWDDGKPFTEEDYNSIRSGVYPRETTPWWKFW